MRNSVTSEDGGAPPEDTELIATLLELAPLGIAIFDTSFRFVEMSSEFVGAADRPRDEYIGKTLVEVEPHIWKFMEPFFHRVLGRESFENQVVSDPTHDGRSWLASFSPIESADEIIGILVVARDLTGLWNFQEELRVRSSLYAMLAQTGQVAASCSSDRELYQKICDTAVDAGGFRFAWVGVPDELVVRPVAAAGTSGGYLDEVIIPLDPDDERSHGPTGRALISGSTSIINDFLSDTLTAPWHELAARVGFGSSASFPITESGVPVAAFAVYSEQIGFFTGDRIEALQNMTPAISLALGRLESERIRRRDTEELVRRKEQLQNLSFLVESSNNAILSKTLDETVTSWNAGASRLYGYSADEMIGQNIARIFPADRLDELSEMLEKVRVGEKVANFESQRIAKSGEVIDVAVTVSPIYDNAGTLVGASSIGTDIRERRRRELEEREFQRRLVALDHFESLGQLAGGIAHDFNNLLSVILHTIGFIERELHDPAQVRADVAQVREAANQAAVLTNQLLAFARSGTTKPEVLDIGTTIVKVEQLMRRALGERVGLVSLVDDHLRPVMMDPHQMEQVLVNLVINARDAISGDGVVTVDVKNLDVDERYSEIRPGIQPGRYVQLRVSDNGSGMDQHTVDRALEPFFTTKPRGSGTGLGLASVYGMVTQAGGDIQLYSELGIGTTVKILLPATDVEPKSPEIKNHAHGLLDGAETVILVEDNDRVRDLTERILTHFGYRVMSCSTGPEAVTLVERGQEVDVILTDLVMPEMLGTEVAERVRALRPELPVIFMSGYARSAVGTILPEGATLLDKPFTEVQLLGTLRAVLDTS